MAKSKSESKLFNIEHWQVIAILLMLYDAIVVNASYFLALWLRFDGKISDIPTEFLSSLSHASAACTLLSLLVFYFIRMYHSIWLYASFNELLRTACGSLLSSAIHTVIITIVINITEGNYDRMPISYYLFGAVIQLMFLLASRFFYRFMFLEVDNLRKRTGRDKTSNRVLLIGAGNAGQALLRDLKRSERQAESDRVVCIIDDNPNKFGRYIDGIRVIGDCGEIIPAVEKYRIDKIYIAIPSASKERIKEIISICAQTNCMVKNLPGVYELVNDITAQSLRDVELDDLLGRDPIKVNTSEILDHLMGKTVLVTGGGGSIGSELCRQIANHDPGRLIIFDIYENNAYDLQLELRKKYPLLKLEVIIGSVRDFKKLNSVFAQFKPDIVYHAAAHKHVPLMEDSPCEAIKNNAFGTYNTGLCAMLHGTKRFVLISTDKAVNPTNIMGASKRICEMVVQSFDRKIRDGKADEIPLPDAAKELSVTMPKNIRTEFVAVRFGNVLGSNGSVVPLFKRQIAEGGPVTVTHPDIIRFFMTIPEAVSLVLTAGSYAGGGEIYVLDMGFPVKIDTLARNLIRLSGKRPDIDIQIVYTGLRPGEKLYEETLAAEEGLRKTDNNLIFIGNPIPFDTDEFFKSLADLRKTADENTPKIREIVKSLVPTYKTNN